MAASVRLSIALAATLALVGCSSAPVQPTPTVSVTPSPTPSPTPMEAAPLTGQEFVAGSLDRAVFMAKIDNHPDARPQFGLNEADVVFEELVEGGMTRYVAIWHSTIPAEVGPVRSIRPMDPDIASPFKGVIAYSGGKLQFIYMMRDTQVENFMHGLEKTAPYMFRTDKRAAPHNVLVKASKVIEDRPNLVAPDRAFTFAAANEMPTAVQFGAPRDVLHARFSFDNQPSWVWDPSAGVYKRKQAGGEWDVDEKGNALTATNVIAQVVTISREFGYVPRSVMIGKGTAYVSTGGKTFKVAWSKKAQNSHTQFTFQDGNVVKLAPGRTWIELVPTTGKFWAESTAE